jgi:hypothetical protein
MLTMGTNPTNKTRLLPRITSRAGLAAVAVALLQVPLLGLNVSPAHATTTITINGSASGPVIGGYFSGPYTNNPAIGTGATLTATALSTATPWPIPGCPAPGSPYSGTFVLNFTMSGVASSLSGTVAGRVCATSSPVGAMLQNGTFSATTGTGAAAGYTGSGTATATEMASPRGMSMTLSGTVTHP